MNATVRLEEGEALFEFVAQFETAPEVGQPVTLRLMVLDFTPTPESVWVSAHLGLPVGWELVEGHTARRVRVRQQEFGWSVVVRPTQFGMSEFRRVLRIDRGRRGVDEGEYLLQVDFRPDSAIKTTTRRLRLETVRHGQRYRYGERFLVPIESPEDFTQGEISQRARAVSQREARCHDCATSDPASVDWVVFVDHKGQLRDARLVSGTDPRSAVAIATRAALQSWSFAPARMGDKQVADWVVVRVPVSE